jgi:hypothetical protein
MMSLMTESPMQLRVWIDCPACGRLQKLARELWLPSELATPEFLKTCAVCDRCRGAAVMCFERSVGRIH